MTVKRRVISMGLLARSVMRLGLATIPFIQSCSVRDRARSGAVLVPIDDLKPGASKVVVDGRGETFFRAPVA
jgi:hypothetical protein